MKHESIVVVYDRCQAIAEEIADKLGAETVCVQSMNVRQIENSQSLVLAVEFLDGGNLSPHWQYASQMFRCASLRGKNLAVMVAHGNRGDNGIYADAFCRELRENGAHIVGDYLYADSVLLRGKYSRTDRHIEQPPLEVIGNPTQYPAGNIVVIDTAPK